jgi:hypothetical protein
MRTLRMSHPPKNVTQISVPKICNIVTRDEQAKEAKPKVPVNRMPKEYRPTDYYMLVVQASRLVHASSADQQTTTC